MPLPGLHGISEQDWSIAVAREAVIRPLSLRPKVRAADVQAAAATLGISISMVYILLRAYRADPTTRALVLQKRGRKQGSQGLDPQIERIVDQVIQDFYRTKQKPVMAQLVKAIAQECRRVQLKPPTWRPVAARVAAQDPAATLRDRAGAKAAADKYRPVRGSYNADHALQIVQVDHTKVDVFVVDEINRLAIQRPWLTLCIDVASRMVAGYYLTLEPPSSASLALALHQAVSPKDGFLKDRGITATWPVAKLPDALHLDNAREFHSAALRRAAEQYGIELIHRPIRTPHFGGHIERLIGTMMGEAHLLPGTTFSNIEERGEYDPERHAVMTLKELEQWFAIQIIRYHNTIHSTLMIPPNLAWEDALAKRPARLREPADLQQFYWDFLPFVMRLVRRDGIRLFNIHYWDSILSVWAAKYAKPLRVKYDPRDLSEIYLEDPEGKHWPVHYKDLRRAPITLAEHRTAIRALRARGQTAVNEQMLFDAVDAQRFLIAEAAHKTKSARRQAQRTETAVESAALMRARPRLPAAKVPTLAHAEDDYVPPGGTDLPYEIEEWS